MNKLTDQSPSTRNKGNTSKLKQKHIFILGKIDGVLFGLIHQFQDLGEI